MTLTTEYINARYQAGLEALVNFVHYDFTEEKWGLKNKLSIATRKLKTLLYAVQNWNNAPGAKNAITPKQLMIILDQIGELTASKKAYNLDVTPCGDSILPGVIIAAPVPTPPLVIGTTSNIFIYEFIISATPIGTRPIAGDTFWEDNNFYNRVVEIEYGNVPMSGVLTNDNSMYFLKPFYSNRITFYNMPGGLAEGTLLKVRVCKV